MERGTVKIRVQGTDFDELLRKVRERAEAFAPGRDLQIDLDAGPAEMDELGDVTTWVGEATVRIGQSQQGRLDLGEEAGT